jgi:hypothetical protein
MPKKQKPDEKSDEPILVTAAKAIGKTAGKIAAAVGVHEPAKSQKIAKLPKKNKSRLPRRQKKAQKKAASLS